MIKIDKKIADVLEDFISARNDIVDNEIFPIKFSTQKIKNFLHAFDVFDYSIKKDLSVDIQQNCHISDKPLIYLPFKINKVEGDFIIDNSFLVTLYNCPSTVEGDFSFATNKIMDLDYFPEDIEGNVIADYNPLVSLDGMIGKKFESIQYKNFGAQKLEKFAQFYKDKNTLLITHAELRAFHLERKLSLELEHKDVIVKRQKI